MEGREEASPVGSKDSRERNFGREHNKCKDRGGSFCGTDTKKPGGARRVKEQKVV